MALWGDKDDTKGNGTVTLKYAGVSTFMQDGNVATGDGFDVIGSVGAGAGTTFGQVGGGTTGDIIKFGTIIGGTYFGDAVIVGIASTTLCTIGSTNNISGATASLVGVDYSINEQPTYLAYDERFSQATLSSAETHLAGYVGLAYTAGIGTTKVGFAYTTDDKATDRPAIKIGDTLAGSYGITALGNGLITIHTSSLTQNAAAGVATVAISTGGISIGDKFTGPNISTYVATIGLGTIGFSVVTGTGLTSGNSISIGRTITGTVATLDGAVATTALAATTGNKITRSTGADKVYIGGISTTGTGSAQGTSYEVQHAGWVGVQTYFDSEGNLRVKSETLVAMSGIATGNNPVLGGDPAV